MSGTSGRVVTTQVMLPHSRGREELLIGESLRENVIAFVMIMLIAVAAAAIPAFGKDSPRKRDHLKRLSLDLGHNYNDFSREGTSVEMIK